jgi:hypothetical protein
VLDNPLNLKSDYDCIEWFDSRLLSRDNFTDVIGNPHGVPSTGRSL